MLQSKFLKLNPEENTFKTILIQTTYVCQMKCSNCYLGNMLNNPNIPNVDYDKLSDVLERLPFRCDIRLLGAEPTMNPQIIDIIKLVRNKGHRPSMLTNGLKLSREPFVKQLKDAGLNTLGISMNGGLCNDTYVLYDNGKYAKQKSKALENCIKQNIVPHINTILTPKNLHTLKPLLEYFVDLAIKYHVKFSPIKFPAMIRPKSIGKLGNFLNEKTYTLSELAEIMSTLTGIKVEDIMNSASIDGFKEKNAKVFKFDTKAGHLLCKITDWTVDEGGVIDRGSMRRGILTEDYKISPAFEYYSREVNKYENN